MTRAGRERPRTYAFGDTAVAARRLRRVAEVFEDTLRQFLREAVLFPPRLALDLGCGPGYTTHLLAEVTGAARSVGMDSSRQFVDAARKTASARAFFVEHDVTAMPLPVAGADVIFARFLLSHLVDPDGTVTAWASQLTPAGSSPSRRWSRSARATTSSPDTSTWPSTFSHAGAPTSTLALTSPP